jgi:hypothetical protein
MLLYVYEIAIYVFSDTFVFTSDERYYELAVPICFYRLRFMFLDLPM